MGQTYKAIDYEWLTKPTSDPFANTDRFFNEYISGQFSKSICINT